MKINKKCIECKQNFISASNYREFCSKHCYDKKYRKNNKENINKLARERAANHPKYIERKAKKAKYAIGWRKKHQEKVREDNRKAIKTGEFLLEDNVIFYGYKPPFKKIEGGYGYAGVLLYSKDAQKVQCHICGKGFRHLNNAHLGKVHGVTAKEYKERFGLSPQSALCGEATREKLLTRGYNPKHLETLKIAQDKRRAIIKETGKDPSAHPKLSLEKRNLRGSCPDQLLERLKKTAEKLGKSPTQEEFKANNPPGYLGAIRTTFGTWQAALTKLGLKTNRTDRTDEELLDYVRDFYIINKRTVYNSDFKRGLLPDHKLYYNRFKNIQHIRLLAGVPLVINLAARGKKEEWMPTTAERKRLLAQY